MDAFSSNLHPYLQGAFLIGETAGELASNLQQRGIQSVVCESLKSAVCQAFTFAKNLQIFCSAQVFRVLICF